MVVVQIMQIKSRASINCFRNSAFLQAHKWFDNCATASAKIELKLAGC